MRLRSVMLSPAWPVAMLVAFPATPAHGQTADSVVTQTVAPGVVHRRIQRGSGPWSLNVLEIDLHRPELSIESVHARGGLKGRERTSTIARTLDARWCASGRRVVAAVNGDLFDLATGEGEGNQIVAGQVLKAAPTTDSPHDTFDNAHTQFAIDARGDPLIERFTFAGELLTRTSRGDTVRTPLDGVNTVRGGAAVLYTSAAGARTPNDSARRPLHETAFAVVARRGDTLELRRIGTPRPRGHTPIPAGHVVLSVMDRAPIASVVRGASGRDLAAVLRFGPDRGPLRTLIGGWGRLVAGGVAVGASADSSEGTFARFSVTRHPRTALGLSRDSATLYLVTVDGRSKRSVGMSLAELGETLRGLGAWDAMNLDGGGSSAMVLDGRVVSVPSDSAGERTIGGALVVARREARASCPRTGR